MTSRLVYQSFCHAGVMNTNHKSVAGFLFSRRRPWLHYTQTQLKLYLNFSVISLFDSNRNMRWLSLLPKPISMCFPVTGWEKFHSPVRNDKYLVIGQVLDNRTFCSVLVSRPICRKGGYSFLSREKTGLYYLISIVTIRLTANFEVKL